MSDAAPPLAAPASDPAVIIVTRMNDRANEEWGTIWQFNLLWRAVIITGPGENPVGKGEGASELAQPDLTFLTANPEAQTIPVLAAALRGGGLVLIHGNKWEDNSPAEQTVLDFLESESPHAYLYYHTGGHDDLNVVRVPGKNEGLVNAIGKFAPRFRYSLGDKNLSEQIPARIGKARQKKGGAGVEEFWKTVALARKPYSAEAGTASTLWMFRHRFRHLLLPLRLDMQTLLETNFAPECLEEIREQYGVGGAVRRLQDAADYANQLLCKDAALATLLAADAPARIEMDAALLRMEKPRPAENLTGNLKRDIIRLVESITANPNDKTAYLLKFGEKIDGSLNPSPPDPAASRFHAKAEAFLKWHDRIETALHQLKETEFEPRAPVPSEKAPAPTEEEGA